MKGYIKPVVWAELGAYPIARKFLVGDTKAPFANKL